MSQGQQQTSSTVLVFEPDSSLRRLITLGLLHRGLHVVEADSLASLEKTDIASVDLLLLDVDNAMICDWELLNTLQAQPRFASLATIALAWELPTVEESNIIQSTQARTKFLPKPFDARILHETIDNLISARDAEQKAREAQMEAVLLAAYSNHPGPSAWPFLTAVGLFLLVVGILLQVALAIFGGLIVVAGLLLWTLSGPPAATRVVLNVTRQ
jgi:CheY-like chemotaxis protein